MVSWLINRLRLGLDLGKCRGFGIHFYYFKLPMWIDPDDITDITDFESIGMDYGPSSSYSTICIIGFGHGSSPIEPKPKYPYIRIYNTYLWNIHKLLKSRVKDKSNFDWVNYNLKETVYRWFQHTFDLFRRLILTLFQSCSLLPTVCWRKVDTWDHSSSNL